MLVLITFVSFLWNACHIKCFLTVVLCQRCLSQSGTVTSSLPQDTGWAESVGLTSLWGHNATIAIAAQGFLFFFFFFQYPEESRLPPLTLSQLGFVRHAKYRGRSSHPDLLLSDALPGQRINRLRSRRVTAPISLLINAATQNEPCSLSHRDTCEFYSVLTRLWHQLTKICVSWVSCFA